MCIGCALVGNVFLVIALVYWLITTNTPYAFGIIAVGLVFQYFYADWSKWVCWLLK